MIIKDLLVHVDNTEWCKQRVADAVKLAERYDAHLSGIYSYPMLTVPTVGHFAPPAFVYTELENLNQELASELEEKFSKWTHTWRGRTSWSAHQGDPAAMIARHSAHHDIVVLGQRNSPRDASSGPEILDRVIIESGRPALVMPNAGAKKTIGNRILVAWNGKKEAARAVHDALPFLKQADAVEVTSINSSKDTDIPCIDIAEHLSRHGVNVDSGNTETKSRNTGEAILYLAKNFAADLIVMGAYGHSRFREYILGGATAYMLENTKIPVLLSH